MRHGGLCRYAPELERGYQFQQGRLLMCNLYRITKNQAAIRDLFKILNTLQNPSQLLRNWPLCCAIFQRCSSYLLNLRHCCAVTKRAANRSSASSSVKLPALPETPLISMSLL